MTIKKQFMLLFMLCLFSVSSSVLAQSGPLTPVGGNTTPQVTTVTANANQVGRYQKFEATFQLNRTYAPDSWLPYYYYDPADTNGVNGITIDGHFIAPSGREVLVPAFYYQDYTRGLSNGTEVMTPSNNFAWKLRFAPEEVGNYQYYITILDKNGSTRYPASGTLAFQSAASASRGFIRVSPRDSRFLEYSNGESYIPISAGHVFWDPYLRSQDFDTVYQQFAQNGVNLTRFWDQNDGYSLTVEGHFDSNTWPDDTTPTDRGIDVNTIPKGTQMNQRGNYQEDKVIEAAERNGIYMLLCSHGDAWWIWEASVNPPYNRPWDDPARLRYWQRNFRYRVARWGYSTSILAWENWNELGHVLASSDIYRFYQTYAQYQQQTDPYHHLRTTSQGSQAWSPGMWSSPAFDMATYHDYMMISRYSADLTYDAANFVYRFAQCLRTPSGGCGLGIGDGSTWQGGQKPIIWGEGDTGTANWNEPNPQIKANHDVRWAGLFSPIGSAPIEWYEAFQSADFKATKFRETKIASDFFKGMDYAGKGFSFLSTDDVRLTSESVVTNNNQLRVLVMRAKNGAEAYAWAQNKGNARWDQNTVPAGLNATFTIQGIAAGSYKVEIWDTYTGTITNGGTLASNNGQLTVTVSNLSKDIAIKLLPVNQPAATPTFTPTPVPATKTLAPTLTATPVPTSTPTLKPTATRLPPTMTPTSTVAPTATRVPPTTVPTATVVMPTQTLVPTASPTWTATFTPIVPTATNVAPTSTSLPSGQPAAQLILSTANAKPGDTVALTLRLDGVTNVYGVEAICSVNALILSGTSFTGGESFNDSNSFIAAQPFNSADGSWRVAASRLHPNPAINGNASAFVLNYLVVNQGQTNIQCAVKVVDPYGWNTALPAVTVAFSSTGTPATVMPTAVPTLAPPPTATPLPTNTLVPTAVPATVTPGGNNVISGTANYPGRNDHSGIQVALYTPAGLAASLTTTSTGVYQFTDVPVGVYSVRLSAPESLTLEYVVTLTTTGTVTDLGTNTLVMGDTDSSGAVDLLDAAFIGANYDVDVSLVPNGDLNRDGIINISDLVLVGSSFGMASPITMQP